MKHDDDPKLRDILDQAADLPPEQRPRFLDQACAGDAILRDEIESLLASLDNTKGLFANPTISRDVADAGATLPPREGAGTYIGHYKLLQQIGEGGMGIVFMAEQERPVRRRVALKIIKPGMDSAAVIARFEAERQALAMMEHPNIAHVYDAGTTAAGRPYFVMELVQGTPITRYCDQKHLALADRLELFRVVCSAVQHAHQKGIIHRDLKPSNILVMVAEGRPVPKIIDFGVAKALHQRLTEKTLFTQFGNVIGTLEYMSPEQAELDVMGTDTRSDIYSLGVVLYELLTGTTPLDGKALREGAYEQMLRTIREQEPPKPSTRLVSSTESLASVSALRGTEPHRLTRLVSGDLDWIVMRCLEKDRARRYETADGLAQDIRRYLTDEPVEASPPSAAYKLRKFARKHRMGLRIAAGFAFVLVAATIVSSLLAVSANAAKKKSQAAESQITLERDHVLVEKRRADEQVMITQAVNDFLNQDFLGSRFSPSSPDARPVADITIREALDRAIARSADRFQGRPLIEAEVRRTIASAYSQVREWDKAKEQFQIAEQLYKTTLGDDDPKTIGLTQQMAVHLWIAGSWQGSNELIETGTRMLLASYQRQCRLRGIGSPAAQITLGLLYDNLHWMVPSVLLVAHDPAMDRTYSDAIAVVENALVRQREVLGDRAPIVIDTTLKLATIYDTKCEYGKAMNLLTPLLDLDGTPKLFETLARVYVHEGRLGEAETLLQKAVESRQNAAGSAYSETVTELAALYLQQKKYAKGEELYLRAIKENQRVLQIPYDPYSLSLLGHLSELYAAWGREDRQEAVLREILPVLQKIQGDRYFQTEKVQNDLIALLTRQKRYPEVTSLLEALFAKQGGVLGVEDIETAQTVTRLAGLYRLQNRLDLAKPILEEALAHQVKRLGSLHPMTIGTSKELIDLYLGQNNLAAAEALAIPLIDAAEKLPERSFYLASAGARALAGFYSQHRDYAHAIVVFKKLVRANDQVSFLPNTRFRDVLGLADAYSRVHDMQNAEPLWRELAEAADARPTDPAIVSCGLENIFSNVVMIYMASDQLELAMKWAPKLRAAVETHVAAQSKVIEQAGVPPAAAASQLAYRGQLYQQLGQFPLALSDFVAAAHADPANQHHAYQAACLQLYLDDVSAYRRTCHDLMERFGGTKDRAVGERTAKACLLVAGAVDDPEMVMTLANQAVAPGATQYLMWFQTTKGMAEYRSGNNDAAVEWLTRSRDGFVATIAKQDRLSLQGVSHAEGLATAEYFIAMVEHRRGRADASRQALEAARQLMATQVPPLASVALKIQYENWLIVQLAAREAEEMFAGLPATVPTPE